MRIVVAPDKFAGSLSAPQVAAAVADGWLSVRVRDEVVCVPLSDGGPGFVDCLVGRVPGEVRCVPVTAPMGNVVDACVLAGSTWYIEAREANGLDLVPVGERDPWRATSAGVGQLIAAAAAAGADKVVVGLGGSATNDGGCGALAALGAVATDRAGRPVDLRAGPQSLREVAAVDLAGPIALVGGMTLTIASDVDNPLLGPDGASWMFARQKGATQQDLPLLEAALEQWAAACVVGGADPAAAQQPGAGAAGGLGYALLLMGADRRSGIDLVLSVTGFRDVCTGADLVITGEGRLDQQSAHGKVVSGVVAAAGAVPVAVVAGESRLSGEQWRELGLVRVETLVERAGSAESAMAHAGQMVHEVAAALATDVWNP